MTPQEVAQFINDTKPDFKDFWNEVKEYKYNSTFTPTDNKPITLFKLELLRIYYRVHPREYMRHYLEGSITKVTINLQPYSGTTNISYSIEHEIETKSGVYPNLILAYVTDLKQYLNPYLRKRLGFSGTRPSDIKDLKDDLFSVELFRNALGKRKLPSTEASLYFNQFRNFSAPVREQYMDILVKQTNTFSKQFLKDVEHSSIFDISEQPLASSKYISLSRYGIRYTVNSNNSLMSSDLFNDRDSEYTPFICGLPRKPTPTESEVSALVSMLFIIASSDNEHKDYIVQCLHSHLSDPAYGTIYTNALANMQAYATTINSFIKDL